MAAAALVVALGGCSPATDLASASEEQTGQPIDDLLQTATTTEGQLQDVAQLLTAQGLVPFDASGSWATCSDDEDSWQYVARGQLLSQNGSSAAALPALTAALQEATGWSAASPATPHSGDRVRVEGQLGASELALNAATDAPDLTVLVLGPCLPVHAEHEDDVPKGTDSIDIGQRGPSDAPQG